MKSGLTLFIEAISLCMMFACIAYCAVHFGVQPLERVILNAFPHF